DPPCRDREGQARTDWIRIGERQRAGEACRKVVVTMPRNDSPNRKRRSKARKPKSASKTAPKRLRFARPMPPGGLEGASATPPLGARMECGGTHGVLGRSECGGPLGQVECGGVHGLARAAGSGLRGAAPDPDVLDVGLGYHADLGHHRDLAYDRPEILALL